MSDATAHSHAGHEHADGLHHDPHLAHHFDTPAQQFKTGKLGIWIFLATEVLMFGGLFCAYTVFRSNYPDVFAYAHRALDVKWGGINTVILISSSFTMAWAVRAAQLNEQRKLVILLSLTLLGGFGFLGIKFIEYHSKISHYLWVGDHNAFHTEFGVDNKLTDDARAADRAAAIHAIESHGAAETHTPAPSHHSEGGAPTHDSAAPKAETGNANPAAQGSHDGQAQGGTGETNAVSHDPAGAAAATSVPAAGDHGASVTPTAPEKSASQALNDPQHRGNPTTVTEGHGSPAAGPATRPSGIHIYDPNAGTGDEAKIKPPQFIPAGLVDTSHAEGHHRLQYGELKTLDQQKIISFFSIYYMMTMLHGVHVLIGMGIITWLLIKSAGGAFSGDYFTPVDIGGLYWHLVDLIWIFLFPLLYLIH